MLHYLDTQELKFPQIYMLGELHDVLGPPVE